MGEFRPPMQERGFIKSRTVAMSNSDGYEMMEQFIRQISKLTTSSECQTCNQSGVGESPKCSEHGPWNMPVDDAVDTVNSLISRARQLVGELKL